jgi:hypothetical protein
VKRSPLLRKTPLRATSSLLRRSALRSRPKPRLNEPGLLEFKQVLYGYCLACGVEGLVRRHHVFHEQHVRREHGNAWDTRNGMWVGVEGITCGSRKIPLAQVPDAAVAFVVDLIGEHRAAAYFRRRYAP